MDILAKLEGPFGSIGIRLKGFRQFGLWHQVAIELAQGVIVCSPPAIIDGRCKQRRVQLIIRSVQCSGHPHRSPFPGSLRHSRFSRGKNILGSGQGDPGCHHDFKRFPTAVSFSDGPFHPGLVAAVQVLEIEFMWQGGPAIGFTAVVVFHFIVLPLKLFDLRKLNEGIRAQ